MALTLGNMATLLSITAATRAGAAAAQQWTAASGPVTVSVDTGSFAYAVSVAGGGQWLADGQVAMTCGGLRYTSSGGGNDLTGGAITLANGTDPALGGSSAVQRTWQGATDRRFRGLT